MHFSSQLSRWDPADPQLWAEYFGFVNVPMFGSQRRDSGWARNASLLLDGGAASISMFLLDEELPFVADRFFSWSWSANARHIMMIDPSRHSLLSGHYWTREPHQLDKSRLPSNTEDARLIIDRLQSAKVPSSNDVVLFCLRLFRSIRGQLSDDLTPDPLRIFNSLLAGSRSVCLGSLSEEDWLNARTLEDVAELLNEAERSASGLDQVRPEALQLRVDRFIDYLCSPAPETGLRLDPSLLLRHAAGELYQEAHLVLEKHAQLALPVWSDGTRSEATPERADVRFTPASLARLLVQQALSELDLDEREQIQVLDPACGSGIFLQMTLEELSARGYSGRVMVRGMDLSPHACTVAEFVLEQACAEHGELTVEAEVVLANALELERDWCTPDVVLMNPPFLSWKRMNEEDRDLVQDVLSSLGHGRGNMAMAFLWKACQSLQSNGGVIASVLPAPLMETQSGIEWREAVGEAGNIRLLGRFQGYGYFRGSAVEPAFVVLSLPRDCRGTTRVVVAEEGQEHMAIRALRMSEQGRLTDGGDDWDVLSVSEANISPHSWLPREGRYLRLIEALFERNMPQVGNLFSVHQGIRTGLNDVFLLTADQIAGLPDAEKHYFRPAVTTGAIEFGRLDAERWVFYPYSDGEPAFESEATLREALPDYFRHYLDARRNDLEARSDVQSERAMWWELSTFRAWQEMGEPRLVSTYFGQAGSFAYDDEGQYVVVQGHAWLWDGGDLQIEVVDETTGESEQVCVGFNETPLPWAYLAFYNSRIFEHLLACFAPRVSGGQFDLSPRYVRKVFLPDLSDEDRVLADVVTELARVGRLIHEGRGYSERELVELCGSVYGLEDVWEELALG